MNLYLNVGSTLNGLAPANLPRALATLAPEAFGPVGSGMKESMAKLAALAETHPHLRSGIIDEAEEAVAAVNAETYADAGGPAPVVNLAMSVLIWMDDTESTADSAQETQWALRVLRLCADPGKSGWVASVDAVSKKLAAAELDARMGRTVSLEGPLEEAYKVADNGPSAVPLARVKDAMAAARAAFGLPPL